MPTAPKPGAPAHEWLRWYAHLAVTQAEIIKDKDGNILCFAVRPIDFVALNNQLIEMETPIGPASSAGKEN